MAQSLQPLEIPRLIFRKTHKSHVTERDICPHYFQSYESLTTDGFQPRKDLAPWPYKMPIDWAANPYSDRNWQFQLNGWRKVEPMLEKYFQKDDNSYLLEAIAVALDWQSFNESGAENPFAWHDMATGMRAARLALFLDRIFSKRVRVPDDATEALLECASEHIVRLRDEKFISKGNHGVFQVFGLSLLASVALGPMANRACQAYCAKMFRKIMKQGYTGEGVHKEHSPSYHLFTTDRILQFNPRRVADAATADLLAKAEKLGPWFVRPDHYVSPLGDSSGKGRRLTGAVKLTHLASGRSFAVADLAKSGYAIVRSDPNAEHQPSMLTVTGNWYSNAHKHNDELSFTLFEHGEPVFVDSGKYGYQYDDKRAYIVSAAAHNTVSFRDPDASVGSPASKGSFLKGVRLLDDAFALSGSVDRTDSFNHERELVYSPEKYLRIVDTVTGPQQQIYASNLHFPNELQPVLTSNGFEVELKCGKIVRGVVEGEGVELELARGATDPMLGWESVGYLKLVPATTIRAIFGSSDLSVRWRIDLV